MPLLRLPSFLRPPGPAAWLTVAAIQLALLLTPVPAHAKNLSLREALAIPAATEAFPPSLPATPVSLPDDWALTRPDYEGPVWYRLDFDARSLDAPLLAAYVERACSNLEVQLNGHLVYSGGRMNEPVSRNCYHSQLVILPTGLLKPSGNRLDIKVTGFPLHRVTARQRAAGLSPVMIGPLPAMQALHERQIFWNLTLAESVGAMLAVVGVLLLALGRLRKLSHLGYFGLLSCLWAALTARLWWRDIPLGNASVELLICTGFAPVAASIVLFLLRYAGYARDRRIDVALWLQCLAAPLALALAGADHLFEAAMLWYALFGLEVLAAIVAFLHRSWQERSRDFWVMAGILCL
ncbi:MAG TPA: sensor histidine kinase, partial [Methylibium sp.]